MSCSRSSHSSLNQTFQTQSYIVLLIMCENIRHHLTQCNSQSLCLVERMNNKKTWYMFIKFLQNLVCLPIKRFQFLKYVLIFKILRLNFSNSTIILHFFFVLFSKLETNEFIKDVIAGQNKVWTKLGMKTCTLSRLFPYFFPSSF